MLADAGLAIMAVVVGFLIGTVGVGGVLLIAALALSGGWTIHEAAATSLVTFVFAALLGTWLYQRRGSIAWRIAAPVCAGAMVFGYLGAEIAARIDARPLAIFIALVIVGAGVQILLPQRAGARSRDGRGWREQLLLAGVGAGSGLGSGLSGAGGAVFCVPLMMMLRYAPLTAVATSQVLTIVAATSGSIGHLRHGFIDWRAAAVIIVFELAGVALGVRLAHVASATLLRRLAGVLCAAIGGLLLARSL